ncbi:MAG: copper resistance protein NlpE [Aequorivita sp.]
MKKTALIIALAATVMLGCKNEEKKEVTSEDPMDTMVSEIVDDHNSQNSLDWAGVYEGTTPCADCEGIKVVLELKNDKTYTISRTYIGKPEDTKYEGSGAFYWGENGSEIDLETDGEPIPLKVGENQLWLLDGDRNIIDGDLADMFILRKKIE